MSHVSKLSSVDHKVEQTCKAQKCTLKVYQVDALGSYHIGCKQSLASLASSPIWPLGTWAIHPIPCAPHIL